MITFHPFQAVVLTEAGRAYALDSLSQLPRSNLLHTPNAMRKSISGIYLIKRGIDATFHVVDSHVTSFLFRIDVAAQYVVSLDTFTPKQRLEFAQSTIPAPMEVAPSGGWQPLWEDDWVGTGVEPIIWWIMTNEERAIGRSARDMHGDEREEAARVFADIKAATLSAYHHL